MKKLLISLLAAGLITTFSVHAAPKTSTQPQEAMTMQVIKEELNLTKESFKSVRLIAEPNGGYNVEIVLTPQAAKKMHNLTASNIKNRVNIVWKNYIISTTTIQSAIGDTLIMTGFSDEQAKSFEKEMQS